MKQMTIETITPEIAAEYLKHNSANRNLKQAVVDRYAADMRAGRWTTDVYPICFKENGCLINGQHRLTALILSGCTIQFFVYRNMTDIEAMNVDRLASRSIADSLNIATPDRRVSNKIVAISRSVIVSSEVNPVIRSIGILDVQMVLTAYGDAIEFVDSNTYGVRLFGQAAIISAAVMAYYSEERDLLKYFLHVLLGGQPVNGRDCSAIFRLRTAIMNSKKMRAYDFTKHFSRLSQRAIKSFCSGQPVQSLIVPKANLYTLPNYADIRKNFGFVKVSKHDR